MRARHAVTTLALALLADSSTNASGLGALPASFSGVLPCADCAGIRYQLNLHPRGGYILALTYLRNNKDETFYDMGEWSADRDTTQVVLDHGVRNAIQFAVMPTGALRKLDMHGQPADAKREDQLRREPHLLPLEPRLALTGTYFYMADAGVLTDCRSGLQFPVAPGGAAHALEQAFLAEQSTRDSLAKAAAGKGGKKPKAPQPTTEDRRPLLVSAHVRVLARPPAGIEGNKLMVLVERLIDTYPTENCGARGVAHDLTSTRWVLTRLEGQPVRVAPGRPEPMLALSDSGGRASGHSGCNRFSTTYKFGNVGATNLTFGPVAGTRMACPPPSVETVYLKALGRVQSYRIKGAHLELMDASGQVLARFESRNL